MMPYLHGNGLGHRDQIHRFGVSIIKIIADMWNFKPHFIRATTWGHPINGTLNYTGVMSLLIRSEADLSTAILTFTPWRTAVIDSGLALSKYR